MERDSLDQSGLEFLVLGPLEVRSGGSPLQLRSAKQRALLAVLLLNANEVVSSDRLIEAVWPEKPPGTATNRTGTNRPSRGIRLVRPAPIRQLLVRSQCSSDSCFGLIRGGDLIK